MTYYSHFGLSGPAFQFAATPAELFLGNEHREALAALEWGLLHEASGYTLFVGEPGAGKTTLAGAALAKHYGEIRAAYVNHPKLDFAEMMVLMSRQLGVEPAGPGKLACLEAFDNVLSEAKSGTRVVIIIDDAQALNDETFEELRLLSDHGRRGERQIQIILVGQPELLQRLQSPRLKQINERIGARAVLHPLTPRETAKYIEHRLRVCGGQTAKVFTHCAIRSAVKHSRGIPRRANILCHNAMLHAFARKTERVKLAAMKAAVADYDGVRAATAAAPVATGFRRGLRRCALVAGVCVIIGIGVLGWRRIEPSPSLRNLESWTTGSDGRVGGGTELNITTHPESNVVPAMDSSSGQVSKPEIPAAGATSANINQALIPASSATPAAFRSEPDAGNTSRPSAGRRPIRIASGDTAGAIALRYYGTRAAVSEIAHDNPQIGDIDHIYPGEVIFIRTDTGRGTGG